MFILNKMMLLHDALFIFISSLAAIHLVYTLPARFKSVGCIQRSINYVPTSIWVHEHDYLINVLLIGVVSASRCQGDRRCCIKAVQNVSIQFSRNIVFLLANCEILIL